MKRASTPSSVLCTRHWDFTSGVSVQSVTTIIIIIIQMKNLKFRNLQDFLKVTQWCGGEAPNSVSWASAFFIECGFQALRPKHLQHQLVLMSGSAPHYGKNNVIWVHGNDFWEKHRCSVQAWKYVQLCLFELNSKSANMEKTYDICPMCNNLGAMQIAMDLLGFQL